MKFGNRRNFILHSTAATLTALSVNPKTARAGSDKFIDIPDIRDSRVKELIFTAVDAAVSSGASYADGRLSHTEKFDVAGRSPTRKEHMGFGVRAIVNGYWGFAASPVWNSAEAARLGRAAVAQAKSNSSSKSREMALAPLSRSESGDWTMPIKDDPFEMAYEEMADFIHPLTTYVNRMRNVTGASVSAKFMRLQKGFGSSLEQYTTQRLYKSSGDINMGLSDDNGNSHGAFVESLSHAGMGFELFRDQPLREILQQLHEEALQVLELPITPILPGRYETLVNAKAIADLISKTIGRPTEVDRAFGYEANAGGTGFIDPIDDLGSYKIGNQKLNISGSRSSPGSVGLVKWDDEGIEPIEFDIVKEGIVVDMQCNREGAGWIGDYLNKQGKGIRSVGCAFAPDAMDVPLVHNVDLTIKPSVSNNSLDSLRSQMKKGVELQSPFIDVDFQSITGATSGNTFEIKDGKRVARDPFVSMLFKTPELWNNLLDMGGANSVRRFGIESEKGEPGQASAASVYAVPVVLKEMTFARVR